MDIWRQLSSPARPVWLAALVLPLVSCATTGPAAPAAPTAPRLRDGEPAPETIRVTRDFSLMPSGDELVLSKEQAAARIPPVFGCGDCRIKAKRASDKLLKAFTLWVKALNRAAPKGTDLRDKAVKRLHAKLGKIGDITLSLAAFDRLSHAPRAMMLSTFEAMIRKGRGPYIVQDRRALASFDGPHVILRVEDEKDEDRGLMDEKLAPDQIKDRGQVKQELARLAMAYGPGLSSPQQSDLVQLATAGLEPTMAFDRSRTEAAREKVTDKIKREPRKYIKGQVLLQKGTAVTHEHRRVVAKMYAVHCKPCTKGPAQCSAGLLTRLRPGSAIFHKVKATREFHVGATPERLAMRKKQVEASVPLIYDVKDSIRITRTAQLDKIFDFVEILLGKERWKQFQDRLSEDLEAKVLLQLLNTFDQVPMKDLRAAVVGLYGNAQAEPIMATKPPFDQPCSLRREKKKHAATEKSPGAIKRSTPIKAPAEVPSRPDKARAAGKKKPVEPKLELHGRCPILPLARLKHEMAGRASGYAGAIEKLPLSARKAVVELVQQLLVPNTTPDETGVARRRAAVMARTKVDPRFFFKGQVVVDTNQHLSHEDYYILEQMFSIHCMPVF